MLGVRIHAPHDLRIEPVETPDPGPGQVTVRIEAGGICGSDLHYYHDGGFGAVRVREPMVLGHEIAGHVLQTGPGVAGLTPGTRIAVNPSQPCGVCRYCQQGTQRHCLDMRFLGSAMRFPHVQGGFRQTMTIADVQAVPIPDSLRIEEAAMAEPLSVCLHAVRQAGPLLGKRVLVTGCGPIGALTIMAARLAGAAEVVATDLSDFALSYASRAGADRALNVGTDKEALRPYTADKGYFDAMFEASGSAHALRGAFEALRPGAVIVQVGIGGEFTLPISVLVAKEFQLRGTFRFDLEFPLALEMMATRRIDVLPILSRTLPIQEAVTAFQLASDRAQAMKVQIAFA